MPMARLGIVLYEIFEFAERVIPYNIMDESRESQFEGKPGRFLEGVLWPRETEAHVDGEEIGSLPDGAYHEDKRASFCETVFDAINQASLLKIAFQEYAERKPAKRQTIPDNTAHLVGLSGGSTHVYRPRPEKLPV